MVKNFSKAVLFALAVLLGLGLVGAGCDLLGPPPPSGGSGGGQNGTKGTITGNAFLLGETDNSGIRVSVESPGGGILANVTTAPDGAYSFNDVDAGDYTVYASFQNSVEKAVSTNVSLSIGAQVTALDLNLTPTGLISGNVTLSDSADPTGVTVFIAGTSQLALTDASGNYTISYVPIATYSITAMKSGYTSSSENGIVVTTGGTATAPNMVLTPLIPNDIPIIQSITANPSIIAPGGTSLIKVSATDNGPLTYSWSVVETGGGTLSGSTAGEKVYTAPSSEGSYTVSVTVSDGTASVSGSIVITVKSPPSIPTIPNHAPIIHSVSANPSLISPGGNSSIVVNASDSDGDSLSYAWSVVETGGGSVTGSGIATKTYTAPATEGSYTVKVDVSDGNATSVGYAIVDVKVNVVLPNYTPVIQTITANPPTISPGGNSTISISAIDPENATLSYSWSVVETNGGTLSGSGATRTYTAPVGEGTYTVQVIVSDGSNSATGYVSIEVSAQVLPGVSEWRQTTYSDFNSGTASGMYLTEYTDDVILDSDPATKGLGPRIDMGIGSSPTIDASAPFLYRLPDGTFRLYYTFYDGVFHQLSYRTSADGVSGWSLKVNLEIGITSIDSASQPYLYKLSDGTFRLYYGFYNGVFSRLAYKTSADGVSDWSNILLLTGIGSASDDRAYAPYLYKLSDGTFRMYYTYFNGNYQELSYQTSPDGVSGWPGRQDLEIGSGSSDQAIDPFLYKLTDGTFRLYYGFYNGTYWRLSYRTSSDGVSFGSRMDLGIGSGGSDGAESPYLYKLSDGTFRVYYAYGNGSYRQLSYRMVPGVYLSSGNLESSAYDTGSSSTFTTLSWNASLTAGTAVKFRIRSASTQAGLSSATWYGPTGTNDYYTTNGSSINSVHNGDRWVQYQVILETENKGVTPTLHDVAISYYN